MKTLKKTFLVLSDIVVIVEPSNMEVFTTFYNMEVFIANQIAGIIKRKLLHALSMEKFT